jgi:hypothetical protein
MRKTNTVEMKQSDSIPQAVEAASKRIHEEPYIFAPGLLLFFIIMVFSAFIMHAGLWGWLKSLKGPVALDTWGTGAPHTQAVTISQNYPRLQISPTGDWQRYRKEQENLLNTYGWVNKTSGIVRIPIEQAMARVAAEGMPNWSTNSRRVSPVELQQDRARRGEDVIP